MKIITFFIFVLLFSVFQNVYPQDTIVIQTGPEGKYANLWTYHPDNNYGHSPVFHTMGWTFFGDEGVIRSIMEFDLSAIPPSAIILEAKLSLYYGSNQPNYTPHTGQNESYLRLITSEWNEETVTWNTAPSTTIEDQVYLPESTEPEQAYTDLDVTTPITKMYNEPDNYHGLMLRLITEYPYTSLMFASGNYDSTELRPKLEIIYSTCELPAVSFTFTINNKTVNFSGICATAGTWSWDFGDGYQSSVQNPVHNYQETGYYTVCLETRNDCGSDTVCQLIFVDYSGISEPDGTIFSIFPNPAQDVVFIKIPKERRAKISLLDLSGKVVLMQNVNISKGEQINFPLSQIEPGIYIIRFDSLKDQACKKLVVVK